MKLFSKKLVSILVSLVFIIFFSLETSFQKYDPRQIHLAIGPSSNNVTITWSTRKQSNCEVRIWKLKNWEYHSCKSNLFSSNENSWWIHSAPINLEPGSFQVFEVGSRSEAFSNSIQIYVPPDQHDSTFLLFGDLCTYSYGGKTVEDMIEYSDLVKIDTIILLGDMAYDLNSNSSKVGDEFMTALEPLVSKIPLMVCAGNHDSRDSYYNYLLRFQMPAHKFYYTFTVGFVRFLAIHTEAFFAEQWMLYDMLQYINSILNRSEDDKSRYPWLIVFGHRPMYCSSVFTSLNCGKNSEIIRNYLEDLFFKYKVDLYINGHLHNYQRTSPVYKGKSLSSENFEYKNPAATIYVSSGAAGAHHKNSNPNLKNPPDWFITGSSNYSFSIMRCFNKSHLEFKQIDRDGFGIIDRFFIIKFGAD